MQFFGQWDEIDEVCGGDDIPIDIKWAKEYQKGWKQAYVGDDGLPVGIRSGDSIYNLKGWKCTDMWFLGKLYFF